MACCCLLILENASFVDTLSPKFLIKASNQSDHDTLESNVLKLIFSICKAMLVD